MSTLQLLATDGHRLSACLAPPEGRPRGGVVVVQEIFGVNSHIRRTAEQYAAAGYLAIAPALFDRVQRDVELGYDAASRESAIELVKKTTIEGAIADLDAAVAAVAHAGRVGMVGYCWGGRLTYLACCKTNVAAGVAYYGAGIAQLLDDTPRCPLMFHFGEHDSHIPLTEVEAIRRAYPAGVYHTYPAGHGFNCSERASFDAASARLAFERTLEFFHSHVG